MESVSRGLVRVGLVALAVSLLMPAAALADTRIEKTLDLSEGGTFRLDTDSGSVTVVGTSSSGAEVVLTSRKDDLDDYYKMTFEGDGREALVKVEKRGRGISSWFRSGPSMRFEVRVPSGVDVFIDTSGGSIQLSKIDGEIDLDTSGGSISVDEVRGHVRADTSGGSIKVNDVEGDVDADTSGGSISVEYASGYVNADTSGGRITLHEIGGDIVADTSGGSIEIDGAGGSVEADTSGGPVTVTFARGNDKGGSLSSSGGRVTAYVDPGVGLEIDASTSGGSVDTDLPVTVRGSVSKTALRGQLNDGGARLRLRSSGGGIRIKSN